MNIHKKKFSIFNTHPNLIYLDSAATSLTPDSVCNKINEYYTQYGVNVSRGIYGLCEQATKEYESVRGKVTQFIGANDTNEIIFTAGTTHSINILAHSILNLTDKETKHVVVTTTDHHANFVPWQHCINQRNRIYLKQKNTFAVIAVDDKFHVNQKDFLQKINPNTTLLALPYISNVLGTINPLKKIIAQARAINPQIIVVVDAAQAASHIQINVNDLDCDFLAFSAHKIYGPTGTGVLWGKKKMLEKIRPLLTGGDMIAHVSSSDTTYAQLPHRLEAGTPNIAGVIGLGAAIDFIQSIGIETIQSHESHLTTYALQKLQKVPDIKIFGPQNSKQRIGLISFTLQNIHPHDIAAILDTESNTAIRAGNHCTMPLHIETLRVQATARVSFGIYNTPKDIGTLIKGLHKTIEVFSKK